MGPVTVVESHIGPEEAAIVEVFSRGEMSYLCLDAELTSSSTGTTMREMLNEVAALLEAAAASGHALG